MSRKGQSTGMKSRWLPAAGVEVGGLTIHGHKESYWGDKYVLKLDCGDGRQLVKLPRSH